MEESQLVSFLKGEGERILDAPQENELVSAFCTALENDITNEGSHHIVLQYTGVLAIFNRARKIDMGVLKAAFGCLEKSIKKLVHEFKQDGENVDEFEDESKQYLRKSFVVILFLLCKGYVEVESEVTTYKQNITITDVAQIIKKRSKKKEPEKETGKYGFWNTTRANITARVVELLRCSWELLWPEVDRRGLPYLRCLTVAFCHVMKSNEELGLSENENDNIFHILGILASRADEEKSILTRLIPLVKGNERMAKTVAECISFLHLEYNRCNVVASSVLEANKVYFAQFQTDTTSEKGFATLLTELSASNPKEYVRGIPYVLTFLESESSTVRSAVLTAVSHILVWHKEHKEDLRTTERLENLRNELLTSTLLEHTKDSNANVRNKSLQLLQKLIFEDKLHTPEIVLCMDAGVKRLLDKAVSVRKQAILLMVTLVKKHPLIVKITDSEAKTKLREKRIQIHELLAHDLKKPKLLELVVEEFLEEMEALDNILPDDLSDKIKDPDIGMKMIEVALEAQKYWEACEIFQFICQTFESHPLLLVIVKQVSQKKVFMAYLSNVLEQKFPDDPALSATPDEEEEMLCYVESEQVQMKKAYITYLKCLKTMIGTFQSVLKTLTMVLDKGAPGDKEEVINLFSELTLLGFKPTDSITVSVVEAISQSKSIDDNLLNHFCTLFLDDPSTDMTKKGNRTDLSFTKKLLRVVELLSSAQRENIIRLVLQLRKKNYLNNNCIQLLWDAFSLSAGAWENSDSSNAAYLLGVLALVENSIVIANMEALIDIGLGERGLGDFNLVKSTCEALLFVCKKHVQTEDDHIELFRFSTNHILFEKLLAIITKGLMERGNRVTDQEFPIVVDLVVQLIFKLCMDPKVIVLKLLDNLHELVFGESENCSRIKNTERILTRYLGVCTALLGCHIMFYESTVTVEVKRRRHIMQKYILNKKSGGQSANSTFGSVSSRDKAAEQSDAEALEMEQIVGNIGYDQEAEMIKAYLETLLEGGIYRQFRIHTFLLCHNIDKYKSLRLKIACVKALAKIMCVSPSAVLGCQDHFVNLWTKSEQPMVKVEIIRSTITLNHRHPNQMEKCNICVQSGLKAKDPSIKKAALDYITFLTLNDLLKIRQQLTEVAVLSCDVDEDVKELARDFLRQCGDKDNVLLNAVPDIISRLNQRKDIAQDLFNDIMNFLLDQIKRDKQTSGLVEKLVMRLGTIGDERVYQDAAYCLAKLPINDKSFKVVKDNFSIYSDKLADDFIHGCFINIIKDARKSCKTEAKARIDEFEKDVKVARDKCVEMKRMEDVVAGRGPKTPEATEESDSDESTEQGEENEKDKKAKAATNNCVESKRKRNVKAGRKTKSPEATDSDDTEDEEENEKDKKAKAATNNCVESKRKRNVTAGRRTKSPEATDSDDTTEEGEENEKDKKAKAATNKCLEMKRKRKVTAGRRAKSPEATDSDDTTEEGEENEKDKKAKAATNKCLEMKRKRKVTAGRRAKSLEATDSDDTMEEGEENEKDKKAKAATNKCLEMKRKRKVTAGAGTKSPEASDSDAMEGDKQSETESEKDMNVAGDNLVEMKRIEEADGSTGPNSVEEPETNDSNDSMEQE